MRLELFAGWRAERILVPIVLVTIAASGAIADPSIGSATPGDRPDEPVGIGVYAQVADAGADADSERNAREDDAERQPLEPTYAPREPEPESWYNSDYIFGMTRGVANSTIAPAGKAPLFVLTVPLDIVILPFALIGGFFG